MWEEFCAAAPQAVASTLVAPPSYNDYRHFINTTLTPGIPGALPPVESLYKDWGGHKAGLQHGQGYYMGDAAKHMQALYAHLGLEVPQDFQAMPDHLVLLLETAEYLHENTTDAELFDFVEHHFDWLKDYRSMLTERARATDDAACMHGAHFYAALLAYIEAYVQSYFIFHDMKDIFHSRGEESRSIEEVVLQ